VTQNKQSQPDQEPICVIGVFHN